MKLERMIGAVDTHTAGEPTRVIVGGIPHIPGTTMANKKKYLEENQDYLRTSLMLEPRGHNDMFGAILTAPGNTDADIGIIFMHTGGYINMCGHGTIGAVTVIIETGMVKAVEPITKVVLDTCAGLVTAYAKVEDQTVKEVSFQNVPSFLFKRDVPLSIDNERNISVDISFGGSFFAIVSAAELGLKVCRSQASLLREVGMKILHKINNEISVQHPILSHINQIDLVEIYDKASSSGAHAKNVVVFGEGQLDRSPCGTGTSAKMAAMIAKGKLQLNEEFIYESIIGTTFKGKAVEFIKINNYEGILPEITGSAYVTGFQNFVIDKHDPLKNGFLLKNI